MIIVINTCSKPLKNFHDKDTDLNLKFSDYRLFADNLKILRQIRFVVMLWFCKKTLIICFSGVLKIINN